MSASNYPAAFLYNQLSTLSRPSIYESIIPFLIPTLVLAVNAEVKQGRVEHS